MVDKNINRINKLGICLRKLKKKRILFIKFHQVLISILNKSKNNFIKIQSIVQENLLIKKIVMCNIKAFNSISYNDFDLLFFYSLFRYFTIIKFLNSSSIKI